MSTKQKEFPKDVGIVYELLDDDVTYLSVRWKLYRQLYDASQKRIELLNEVASTFFYDIHYLLVDAIILSVCRLTDPARTGSNKNLALERLVDTIQEYGEVDFAADLRSKLEELRRTCEPLRTHRHKRLGHSDLDRRLDPKGVKLPAVSMKTLRMCFDALARFVNEVSIFYTDNEVQYDLTQTSHDGETLVEALKSAVVFESMRDEDAMDWWQRRQKSNFYDA